MVVPEWKALSRNDVDVRVKPCPAVYVVFVSVSVPQEKRPVVVSQRSLLVPAVSQSTSPTPLKDVPTKRDAPDIAPSTTSVPELASVLSAFTSEPDVVVNRASDPVRVSFVLKEVFVRVRPFPAV
jgi:hypothetical protein